MSLWPKALQGNRVFEHSEQVGQVSHFICCCKVMDELETVFKSIVKARNL